MIVVRLMGGLGNQMFQYAAGRQLALTRHVELVLDLGWFRYDAPHSATPRAYELDRFGLGARTIELPYEKIRGWEERPGRFPLRRRHHVIRQDASKTQIDERVPTAPDNTVLVGYWQNEGYFAEIADTLRSEFSLGVGPVGDAATPGPPASDERVSVHIRRGDYANHPPTTAIHGVLPTDYYRRAIAHLAGSLANPEFIAFSDDPDWVETELASELSLTVSREQDAFAELRLMTQCKHHVIANSSFSWWGAWLGEQPESIVVAPVAWFADPGMDASGIVPARWLQL